MNRPDIMAMCEHSGIDAKIKAFFHDLCNAATATALEDLRADREVLA